MPYLTAFLEYKDIAPMGASSCVTHYNSAPWEEKKALIPGHQHYVIS